MPFMLQVAPPVVAPHTNDVKVAVAPLLVENDESNDAFVVTANEPDDKLE